MEMFNKCLQIKKLNQKYIGKISKTALEKVIKEWDNHFDENLEELDV